jgi:hypothetical protein
MSDLRNLGPTARLFDEFDPGLPSGTGVTLDGQMTEEVSVGDVERRLVEVTRPEAIRLLASVSYGRIVFTRQALPAIRPIAHIVDDDAVIVRTHLGAAVHSANGVVVAYEADEIDPLEHVGWSVIVTGLATPVHDPELVAHYEGLLRPWVNGHQHQIVRINPELVTGFHLTRDPAA